jgi:hypothetical protein
LWELNEVRAFVAAILDAMSQPTREHFRRENFCVAEIGEIPTENGVVLDSNLYNPVETWVESRIATSIVKTTRKTTSQKL